jgi:hypothetical protein
MRHAADEFSLNSGKATAALRESSYYLRGSGRANGYGPAPAACLPNYINDFHKVQVARQVEGRIAAH